jgi:hypothetical protein
MLTNTTAKLKDLKNMKTIKEILFDGYCPQCQLEEKQEGMLVNSEDFWECPKCHLQMTAFPPYATILRWRGNGKFKIHEYRAVDHAKGLLITRPQFDSKNEIYPDQSELLTNSFDLEEYLTSVDLSYSDYQKNLFNSNAPELKEQESYLEKVCDEEWENLIELFKAVERKGIKSEEFQLLHQMLYDLRLVFSFDWIHWYKGQKAIQNASLDLTSASLLDLSMYLTLICRSDHFDDISIRNAFERSVFSKIFERLNELT